MMIKTTEQIVEETNYIYSGLYKPTKEDEKLLKKKWIPEEKVREVLESNSCNISSIGMMRIYEELGLDKEINYLPKSTNI